ncbi:MAG: hypothetical protein U0U66_04480 [Cytophagaceae bacterium]
MSNFLSHITEFLFDENRRLSSKAAVVVLIILAIFIVDNILGFSYYYSTDKKIEQVQKLNSIINNASTDSITKSFSIKIRSEVIERGNVFTQSLVFLKNFKWYESGADEVINIKPKITKSDFWFNITSGGLYYFIAIIILPIYVFTDKNTSIMQRVGTGILMVAIFYGMGMFFGWLCSFIPQISNTTWGWNYLLNSSIQFLIIVVLGIVGQNKD